MKIVELIAAARSAADRAYAPYSNLRVGAMILTRDQRTYAGCNMENASYGLSMCAERNAAAAMVLDGVQEIQTIAIVSPEAALCFPCGACRQVLHEFGCREVAVVNGDGVPRRYQFEEILPYPFGLDHP